MSSVIVREGEKRNRVRGKLKRGNREVGNERGEIEGGGGMKEK
jgi:hypothetical protein